MNGEPIDVIGREEIVSAVARAALLGARGNSGVILSQIVRGAAEELASRPGELVDPILVSAALARAADAAYASVRDPAEGTMLSAVRAMAQPRGPRPRPHGHAAARPRRHAGGAGRAARRGARERARGRQGGGGARPRAAADPARGRRGRRRRLRPHRDRRGLSRGAARRRPPRSSRTSTRRPRCTGPSTSRRASATAPTSPSPARASTPAASRRCSRTSATRVLVVGDERTLRVHVHTDEPDAAVALFEPVGEVSRFDVADMHEQVAERSARLAGDVRRRRRSRPAPSSPWPAARVSSGSTRSSARWWWTAGRR